MLAPGRVSEKPGAVVFPGGGAWPELAGPTWMLTSMLFACSSVLLREHTVLDEELPEIIANLRVLGGDVTLLTGDSSVS